MNAVGRIHPGRMLAFLGLGVLAALAIAAQPAAARGWTHGWWQHAGDGHVFTLTNGTQSASDQNQVIEFNQLPNGQLQQVGAFNTGGLGGQEEEHGCALPTTGTCPFIDAQNEVILSDHNLLFAVNPGSNTISSFRVERQGLKLLDQAPSGGTWPTSVTTHGDLLYVLNSKSLSIAGLRVSRNGQMTPIPHSVQPVSAGATSADVPPKEIQFDNTGTVLAVTLLAVPVVDTFKVGSNGVAGPAHANATAYPFPFAFSVTPEDQLAVAEIVDPNDNTPVSQVSTYQLNPWSAQLTHLNSAADDGFAACWTAITHNGRYLYVVNTGGGAPSGATVSAFRLTPSGGLSLLQVTTPEGPGAAPGGVEFARTDDAVSRDDRYLYVLVPGVLGSLAPGSLGLSRIDEYSIGQNGQLTAIGQTPTTLPPGVSGMAAG